MGSTSYETARRGQGLAHHEAADLNSEESSIEVRFFSISLGEGVSGKRAPGWSEGRLISFGHAHPLTSLWVGVG